MALIIICVASIALLFITARVLYHFTDSDIALAAPIGTAVVPFIGLCTCLLFIILSHNDYLIESSKIKYEQQYKALTAAIEKNEQNLILLADDIAEYNSGIINGRRAMNDFWLKDFNYDFYEDLPLIDLESEAGDE